MSVIEIEALLGEIAADAPCGEDLEYDPAIAGVYADNIGDHVIMSDVAAVDYSALPAVDLLHASPACTRAAMKRNFA